MTVLHVRIPGTDSTCTSCIVTFPPSSDCCFNCLLSTFCYCFVSPCWRGNIRDANGIDGGFVSDCLTMFCCASCAVCQMHHQAKQTVLLAPPGPPGMMHN